MSQFMSLRHSVFVNNHHNKYMRITFTEYSYQVLSHPLFKYLFIWVSLKPFIYIIINITQMKKLNHREMGHHHFSQNSKSTNEIILDIISKRKYMRHPIWNGTRREKINNICTTNYSCMIYTNSSSL